MFGGSVLSYLSWQQDKAYPGVAKFGIALEWGSRGRWFESSHSDQKRLEIARFQAFFALSWQNGIVKLSKSAQESAQTLKIGALSFTNTREIGNGYHLGGAVPEIFIDNFTARWYSTREKTAMTEKSPQLSVQREARQVKGLYGRRRAVPLPSGPG